MHTMDWKTVRGWEGKEMVPMARKDLGLHTRQVWVFLPTSDSEGLGRLGGSPVFLHRSRAAICYLQGYGVLLRPEHKV